MSVFEELVCDNGLSGLVISALGLQTQYRGLETYSVDGISFSVKGLTEKR